MTAYQRSTLPPPPLRHTAAAQRHTGAAPPHIPDRTQTAGPAQRMRTSSVSPAAEFLGYAGGVLTTVAALYLAADWWGTLDGFGQVLLLLAGSGALGAAAAVVGDSDDVARRLSTLLWWLTSATALTTTYLFVDRVALLGNDAALLAAGLSGFGIAGYQWRSRGGVALHLPTFGSLLVSVAGAASVASDAPGVLAGALWVAGAAWLGLGMVEYLSERRTGVALGAVTVLGACQAVILDHNDAGLLLAIVTTVGLGALSLMRRETLLSGLATLAALVFGPQVGYAWLIDYMTGTVVALGVGLAMLAGCIFSVVLARRRLGEIPSSRSDG